MWNLFVRCKPSRPKGARERNKEICRITMGLVYDDDLRTSFVQSIKNKMADFNLKKIYLASPPNVSNIACIRKRESWEKCIGQGCLECGPHKKFLRPQLVT